MKRLIVFVLACALSAWAQGRPAGAGRPSGVGGGSSSGMGTGNASSMGHGSDMGHSDMGTSHRPSDTGKQAPDHALSTNSKLSSKLDSLLPNGMTAQQACSGFKNLGQCVAAIHVSHNLGISFGDLKSKMTGSGSESLGKAIHDLKPDANAKAEEKKAKQQADDDLKES
jgi:hypothetical protein